MTPTQRFRLVAKTARIVRLVAFDGLLQT